MSAERRRELHRYFRGQGYKAERQETSSLRYRGTIKVGSHPIEVAWELPKNLEFTRLPTLYILADEDDVLRNVVAHRAGTYFCYAREGQVLDRYDISGTMQMCMERAVDALKDAVNRKDFSAELAEEFTQHWLAHSEIQANLQMQVSYLGRVIEYEGGMILEDKQILKGTGAGHPAWVERVDMPLTFPPRVRAPSNLQEFLNWAETVRIGLRNKLQHKLIEGIPNRIPDLYFRAPNAIVGIRVAVPSQILMLAKDGGAKQVLNRHGHEIPVLRYAAERADPEFIYSRNTGSNCFAGRRIAVVGCGTIGSHLARFLAQSGAGYLPGSLVLVDYQKLKAPNIGRHLLGFKAINRNKAEAMVDELRQYPNLHVRAETSRVEDIWGKFDDFDLVIDATGHEGTSNALNQYFTARRSTGQKCPAVLHVWLEGLGEAAQALLVKDSTYACYKCLHPVLKDEPRHSPLLAGYKPAETPATCGDGAYMQYGVGASAIAAGLAFNMATDFMRGRPGHLLRTVLIAFKNTKQVANQNPTRSTRCPACGDESRD